MRSINHPQKIPSHVSIPHLIYNVLSAILFILCLFFAISVLPKLFWSLSVSVRKFKSSYSSAPKRWSKQCRSHWNVNAVILRHRWRYSLSFMYWDLFGRRRRRYFWRESEIISEICGTLSTLVAILFTSWCLCCAASLTSNSGIRLAMIQRQRTFRESTGTILIHNWLWVADKNKSSIFIPSSCTHMLYVFSIGRRALRRSKHLLCSQTRPSVFDKSTFGAAANFLRTNGHWHRKILNYLHLGAVCLRLR